MAPVKHYTEQTFPVEISKISANTPYLPLFTPVFTHSTGSKLDLSDTSEKLRKVTEVNVDIIRCRQLPEQYQSTNVTQFKMELANIEIELI